MSWGEIVQSTMLALGIVFVSDLIVGMWLGRALRRLRQAIPPINAPRSLTHRQSSRISERSGKGDEAAFHTTAITTEVDQ